jgi:predicted AAA+ superfamily ATPase
MINRYFQLSKFIDKNKAYSCWGPRGTGKTKLLESTLPPKSIVISLLESENYHRYLSDPSLFSKEIQSRLKSLNRDEHLVIAVDEVQKLPRLLDEVHSLIEKFKGRLVFVLTGSSARKLKRSGGNLLAARALTTNLHPISVLESELDLDVVLRTGSLPGVYFEREFAQHRLRTYIGPDVPRFCFSNTPREYELPSGIKNLPWREGLALMKSF